MLDFNTLAGFDGVTQPLPVIEPEQRDGVVIDARQQAQRVQLARKARQLINVAVTQRLTKRGFQFRGVAREVDIGEAFPGNRPSSDGPFHQGKAARRGKSAIR